MKSYIYNQQRPFDFTGFPNLGGNVPLSNIGVSSRISPTELKMARVTRWSMATTRSERGIRGRMRLKENEDFMWREGIGEGRTKQRAGGGRLPPPAKHER